MMRRILNPVMFVATLLALACGQALAQANDAGLLYASRFGAWTVPAGNDGGFQWSSPSICQVPAQEVVIPAFSVGTPITIVDSNPALSETITPTAVSISASGCMMKASPANVHRSYFLRSGTAGLQEALNFALAHEPTGVVVLTPEWTAAGGTTLMITSAAGDAAVTVLDARTSVLVPYTWDGTHYEAGSFGGNQTTTLTGPVTGSGKGTIQTTITPTGVAGGADTVTFNIAGQLYTYGADGRLLSAGNPFAASITSCSACGTREAGNASSSPGTFTFQYAYGTPTGATLIDSTDTGVGSVPSPFTTGTIAAAYCTAAQGVFAATFALRAVSGTQTANASASVSCLPRVYYGTGASGATGVTVSGTTATLVGASGALADGGLNASGNGTYNFTPSSNYLYIATPGGCTHSFSSGGFAFPMISVAITVTNPYRAQLPYCLSTSSNGQNLPVSLLVQ